MSTADSFGSLLKRSFPALALLTALLAGLWMWHTPATEDMHRFRLFALGTLVDVQVAGPLTDDEYTALATEMADWLDTFETRWSVVREGALSAINAQLTDNAAAQFPDELQADFVHAQRICQQSAGRFDPAIGQWIRLWGFEREEDGREEPPTAAEIAAKRSPSWCDARIDVNTVTLSDAGARLNFGGMAKGRAVDGLLELLRTRGHTHALVNAGGDLKVSGPPAGRDWRIGIRDPRAPGEPRALAAIALHEGEALFSSGDYERYFVFEGQRYHHLLDPHSGSPARRSISATVLHSDAALADAAATALFVAGPQAASTVAETLGLTQWMVIGPDGTPVTSPALAARLEWITASDAPG